MSRNGQYICTSCGHCFGAVNTILNITPGEPPSLCDGCTVILRNQLNEAIGDTVGGNDVGRLADDLTPSQRVALLKVHGSSRVNKSNMHHATLKSLSSRGLIEVVGNMVSITQLGSRVVERKQ